MLVSNGIFAVRLCPDRLKLVEECLKKKSGAHRNPSKILQLAACLNISNENPGERQGRALVLVAEAGFHVSICGIYGICGSLNGPPKFGTLYVTG